MSLAAKIPDFADVSAWDSGIKQAVLAYIDRMPRSDRMMPAYLEAFSHFVTASAECRKRIEEIRHAEDGR